MGYGGRTASSSVPDETVARLRASGGKAVPGAKPKQIEVEQLPAKRPPKPEPPPAEVPVAAGNGQVSGDVVDLDGPPPTPEAAPELAEPPTAPAALKVSRGATPQDVAGKIGATPAEVVKTLI